MKPTKEDWDRFGREIMTGGRSEDVTTERNYENIIKENTKLKQVISRAIELTNEILSQGWDYYEKDKIAYKLLDILELGE